MVTYTLTTPFSTGTMSNPITVQSLHVTSVWWTSTPGLAPLGTQELEITLTDPTSGWQETISYQDSAVGTFWTAAVTANAESLSDVVAAAVLNKLVADGKLPAGTISTTASGTSGQTGTAS